jgi:hypothetical protein
VDGTKVDYPKSSNGIQYMEINFVTTNELENPPMIPLMKLEKEDCKKPAVFPWENQNMHCGCFQYNPTKLVDVYFTKEGILFRINPNII